MAKKRKFNCNGCSANYDGPTKISRHWDKFPKHMTDVQARRRKYSTVSNVRSSSPLPTTAESVPKAKGWKHCPWCGGKLR